MPVPSSRRANAPDPQVEVFALEGNLFCAMTYPSALLNYIGARRIRLAPGIMRGFPEGGVLIAGVTAIENSAKAEVERFASLFEGAIKASMDGRRSRHIDFSWESMDLFSSRRGNLVTKIEAEDSGFKFTTPEFDQAKVGYAELFSRRSVRELIRELSESGFAREQELLSKRGAKHDEFQKAIDDIRRTELLSTEYLLQCRKTSSQLLKTSRKDDISSGNGIDLRCASCNRPFSDELIAEGYSLNKIGKEMLNGSHWMTVWVSNLLVKLGVPLSSTYWNIEESSEEVDIVADYIDRVWIFELKDRDFGAGDAYPFNYRKARYSADKAVIVTTGKVSADARRVFSELGGPTGPIIIEGLEHAENILKYEFERASLVQERRLLSLLAAVSGYEFSAMLPQVSEG
ncbi:hypothetical protein [Amycolatopsis saalfeldensis]|uniref:Restriction endonuclease n=1 Tax=Amycolatopsis saalfeldensis TaxID=394193 RepID=A0A1H8WY42_9PSEU|nr:hypothetical protein [Amycolatopsis saalfeldensis]SEP32572.1 hypothetical protein SAMN04489732_10649 [Amycolatopsis saalfeldensis]